MMAALPEPATGLLDAITAAFQGAQFVNGILTAL